MTLTAQQATCFVNDIGFAAIAAPDDAVEAITEAYCLLPEVATTPTSLTNQELGQLTKVVTEAWRAVRDGKPARHLHYAKRLAERIADELNPNPTTT